MALTCASLSAGEIDALRGMLRIGIHWDAEVTEAEGPGRPLVSQAFCSVLPMAYQSGAPADLWPPFAELVLEAAYEATLTAVLNARRGALSIVLLTRLGGSAFDNPASWIDAAMRRALTIVRELDVDVRLVSHGAPPASMAALG